MFAQTPRTQVLPEMFDVRVPAAPTVTIDTSLGIPPESTGFDFDVFYDFARTVGYTDEEISTHTQHFSGRSPRLSVGRHRRRTATVFIPKALEQAEIFSHEGRDLVEKEIGINIFKDLSPSGIINEVAVHEFGHDHDMLHLNGRRDTRIHIARQLIPRLAFLGFGVYTIAEIFSSDQTAQVVIPSAGVLASAAIVLSQNRGPRVNRHTERVAYRFQEQYGDVHIVNFDPVMLDELANRQKQPSNR